MDQRWAWTFGLILYAALIWAVAAGALSRYVRTGAIAVAASFLAILTTWPFAPVSLWAVLPTEPWPWYLCNVATAAAAIAFSELIATGYTLLIATTYFLVRLTPSGGGVGAGQAALDSGYAFIVGIATVLIIAILRRSTARADGAETAAIIRYAAVTTEHAMEVERMNVDALLHDNVMSSLLAASRAHSPAEYRYATALARTALDVIAANTDAPTAEPVSFREVTERFTRICQELGIHATLTSHGLQGNTVPATVAEVFFAATLQALMNSVQHAGPGPIHRSVTASWQHDELTATITDDGAGFDTTQPSPRLGIRTSIIERLTSIGGTATITSAPGEGTTVTLTWKKHHHET
jgi:hypothetical protein